MFGCTPKIPFDVEMGVTLIEQGDTSHQNYVKKLKARLEWVTKFLVRKIRKSLNIIKSIMTKKIGCMSLTPNDLVLVHVKAPTSDHKIAD